MRPHSRRLAPLGFSLRSLRISPLLWGGSLGVFCGLIAAVWPSIEDSIGKALQSYPESLKKTFNIQTLNSVEQYVDVEMLSLIVPLAVAYYAMRLATRETVQSQEEGFLDSLLALPIRRSDLVWSSFFLALLLSAAALLMMWILCLTGAVIAGVGIHPWTMWGGFFGVWPLGVFFAGVAACLAGVFNRSAVVLGVGSAILVGMYVLDLLGKISGALEWMREISAFHYYGSIIQNGWNPWYSLGLTLAGFLLALAGSMLFTRKDLV